MKNKILTAVLAFSIVAETSCYRMHASRGGGQTTATASRAILTSDIAVHPGYQIESIATGLNFPSGATFDDKGHLFVVEAGYCYGEVWTIPKLIRIDDKGNKTTIAEGGKNGPWTGVTFYDGNFYVAEGGELEGGKILRITASGEMSTIVEGLPSVGDHHTNGPVIKDGYIYFGQGTATNSAVVGEDNASFGWLSRRKDFHDIPCKDIELKGENYESENVLTDAAGDKATTGAFLPFGTPSTPGQVIKGMIPCTGAIMRVSVNGGQIELVAWGLRNPFGLAVSGSGDLYITENAYDDRGSRPVWGTGDVLYKIETGKWYGWPDYSAAIKMENNDEFKPPGKSLVKPVMSKYPNEPPSPTAVFAVHTSADGIDFSKSSSFGFEGEAFVAEFGDMAPNVGKVWDPVGFKVVRVDVKTGVIRDFAVNKGKRNGPASKLKTGGLERPVAVKFDAGGNNLIVVDFGILTMGAKGAEPRQNTGVIWRISKK
jgi:glucose/arabinose dehydrogenase